ncbi:MAG: helix-turn-helix transcriptional regulator [Planctomycetes bacterium]|nr:helix-turn-helix transcriptional regulator [Planctomycetota bacterium]
MTVKILELAGKRWAIMPEKDYKRLAAGSKNSWPELPISDAHGRYPAVEYARTSLARKIIGRRRMAGLTQVELARRAGIRPETLNRIEKGRTTPDVATIAKIEHVLMTADNEEK